MTARTKPFIFVLLCDDNNGSIPPAASASSLEATLDVLAMVDACVGDCDSQSASSSSSCCCDAGAGGNKGSLRFGNVSLAIVHILLISFACFISSVGSMVHHDHAQLLWWMVMVWWWWWFDTRGVSPLSSLSLSLCRVRQRFFPPLSALTSPKILPANSSSRHLSNLPAIYLTFQHK